MTGKTVIVTGGSRGIGKAVCLQMAKCGANVVINYCGNEEMAIETMNLCKEFTENVCIVKGNVAVLEECEEIIKMAIDTFGGVDILVNNAGITRDGLIMRMRENDFTDVIDVNLKGCYHMMKLASTPMMRKRYGRIINISSIVGIVGNAGQVNYAASKAGIIGMTKTIAKELASRNITVNAVAPGFVETDMTSNLPENVLKNLNIPLGRLGNPDDIANIVCFLASDKASYITGQVISVDGGMAI
ncbi:MAG: 3-oxoacyl-[acyl-carrier-protein] reductase [Oscillospiraceae bacterium]